MEQQVQAGMLPIQANKIYEEIVSVLAQAINADVKVTISVEANFKGNAEESIIRAVKENVNSLGIEKSEWS